MDTMIEGPAGALRIHDEGAGEVPILFVHALGCDQQSWRGAFAALGGARRLLAFDLRGHGGSAAPRDGDYSIDAQAGDLLAVLDARGVERAVFVGHSLGAMVAAAAAAQAPERCAGLFLIDPGSDPSLFPPEQAEQYLALFAIDYRQTVLGHWDGLLAGASEETRRLAIETLLATPPATVVGNLRALGGFRAVEALSSYGGRIFVLAGPMGAAPVALQNVLGLEHEVVDGVSHFVHLDQPAVFAESLRRFLER